jgi:penicillin-binding protein 2
MLRGIPFLIALAIFAVACGGGSDSDSKEVEPPKTPEETVERFLTLWQEHKYPEMYELVSSEARLNITGEKFVERYTAITDETTITDIKFVLKPSPTPGAPEVSYSITLQTAFFGDIKQENAMTLVQENIPQPTAAEGEEVETKKEWRIVWTPSLIFEELDDRSLVHFFTRVPRRGGIYDRMGRELAVDASLAVIGIVPDLLTDKEAVIARLTQATGLPGDQVRAQVETTLPSYYFIPIKTLPYGAPPEEVQKYLDMVDLGVVVREETQRVYPQGASASHIVGYMTEVTEEQLKELGPKGYEPGEKIGAFGLEGSMDAQLGGERGGLLATITPEGSIAREIAEKPSVPGKDVHLTIDMAVQRKAEGELGERVGSIVVMDPRDNAVLALATFPRFDPNAFYRGLTPEEFAALNGDARLPFLNRPLAATYPTGSVFKVVTFAAGVEKGGYSTGSRLPCPPVWTGLGEQFAQKNWQTTDRGHLTPAEVLMASCNPVFFELARAADEADEYALPNMARSFGYGSPSGINGGLEEASGTVPDPKWKEENIGEPWYRGDAVNMGIGQGFVTATPLQIANAYSAISATGVLRKPLLVRKVSELGGTLSQDFAAETVAPLPVSPTTLDGIREGLGLVIHSPGGTSSAQWVGSSVDAAGKSGTAEDIGFGSDHVFFVAYANRGEPSVIALAALETGESGSREAAPMVRRILEAYIGGALVSAGP